jgi:hypothetical protein
MSQDHDKLKRLIHYIIWRAGDQPGFGATKLYKVLWFAEARAYVLRGKPITGAIYVRDKYGPVPRLGKQVREQLRAEGKTKETQEPTKRGSRTRFKAVTRPEVSDISADDIKEINWWIDHIVREHTAETISDLSHDYAWEIAKQGEEIPLYAILANRIRDPKDDELDWVKSKIKQPDLF